MVYLHLLPDTGSGLLYNVGSFHKLPGAKRERSKMAVGTPFILLKDNLGKILAPLKVGYVEVKKKSRAGIEYSHYKKEIMLSNSINK